MPWFHAGKTAQLAGRDVIGVRVEGRPVAIYTLADGLYATSNVCPHMGALLSHGEVVQGYVECPMHHALFDIRTGAPDGSVTDRALRTFPVKVEADDIYVEMPAAEETAS